MVNEKAYGQHIDRPPDEIVEAFSILGVDAAQKRAKLLYLEDMEKVFLARLKNIMEKELLQQCEKPPSETKIERLARADTSYVDFLDKLDVARKESFEADVLYKAEDKRIELIRSLESTTRAHLNKFGV